MKIREIAKGTFKVMFGVWLGLQAYEWTKAVITVSGKKLVKHGFYKLCDLAGVDRTKVDEAFGDVAAKEEEEES